MTNATLYAPEVDELMRMRNAGSPDFILPLDLHAQALVALLHGIVPDHGTRVLWIRAERGPIEAFGSFEELHADGLVDDYDEFRSQWLAGYPDPEQWYELRYDEQDDTPRLSINDRFTVRFVKTTSVCADPALGLQLMSWLVSEVERCVRECAQGTYNDTIRERLPFSLRTGVLSRKAYWRIFPESHAYFRHVISDEDIDRFSLLFDGGPMNAPLPTLCANGYYDACRIVFSSLGIAEPAAGAASADWYAAYANPRGASPRIIDQESPGEFASWIADGRADDHTWQILPGPGFSWMALEPVHGERGWTLELRSADYPMSACAMRAALALHDAGLPVRVPQAHTLACTARGEDRIGILPQYVMPPYDDVAFPDPTIVDYLALPYDHTQEVIRHTQWYPLPQVRLFGIHDSPDATP